MLDFLKHRGRDGQGTFVQRGLGIGMRRLAIIDVAHGHQPYVSEDGRIVAVFNGELYNYPHLQHELKARGHRLRSDADGETLVHLYEEYGDNLLSHIAGMFALAVFDQERQQLLLARDRIGQKPLYILEMDHTLAFASEMKAFLGLNEFNPAVDERFLASYLGHRFTPAPHTLMRRVTKLRPGEALRVKADGRRERWLYWQPTVVEPITEGTITQWARQLDQLLSDVVKSHLVADVPVGLFLSGGLDSSVLAALVSQANGPRVEAWSAAFAARFPGYDEFGWAKQVADQYHFPIRRIAVDSQITPDRVRQLAYILDEPMGDPTVLPLDGVAEAAGQFHRVMLSGEGADEIFGGYAGYGEVQSLQWVRKVPYRLRQWWVNQGFKGAGAFARAAEPMAARYRGVGMTFSPAEQERLLTKDLLHPDRPAAVREYWQAVSHLSELQAMQGFDVRWFLPDDVLLKADRIGMHHNIEIRVPYCDHAIVEFALQIPLALRRTGRLDKRVLRQVARRYLPGEIVWRPKNGFPTPLTALMAGPLYDTVYDSLTDHHFTQRGWFQRSAVQALLGQLAAHNPVAARQSYALLMLELWTQELVDKGVRQAAQTPSSGAILPGRPL